MRVFATLIAATAIYLGARMMLRWRKQQLQTSLLLSKGFQLQSLRASRIA
jgi:hypothetical protein